MIRLTRMNHQPVVINAHVIVYVEATPDTLLTLSNGDRVHVRESVDEVVERVREYQRDTFAGLLRQPAEEAA